MTGYDRTRPLVFIHVPKTAGSAVRQIVRGWFGPGFIPHYYSEKAGGRPRRDAAFERHSATTPVCVFGHFNRLRQFGVEDNYPDATQFVTILRDPFEMAISEYYYIRKVGQNWKDRSRVPTAPLAEHLMTMTPNMLNHFPRPVTPLNYKDIIDQSFVEIGFAEDLAGSLTRLARCLDKPFDPATLGEVNATARDSQETGVQALRPEFRARHPLEYDVYDYARARFGTPAQPTSQPTSPQ